MPWLFMDIPEYTGDIDFFVRPDVENAAKIPCVLKSFGFGSLGIAKGASIGPDKVVQLGYPPNRIDLMTSISGIDFEKAWHGRVHAELDGLPVFFLSREALILNKRTSGRTKDLADLEALRLQEAD